MILNDVGLWTTIGIEMFCGPFGKVFLTFLEHQGVEIFQACFGVPKWQQTRTHKKASSVKCVANRARSNQSRRSESPTNSAWDLSNLLCLSRSTAPANELKREPTSPFLLNVEFQSDSRPEQQSKFGQTSIRTCCANQHANLVSSGSVAMCWEGWADVTGEGTGGVDKTMLKWMPCSGPMPATPVRVHGQQELN